MFSLEVRRALHAEEKEKKRRGMWEMMAGFAPVGVCLLRTSRSIQ